TLRIGWPQLELGSSVTSPIRTTNAAVTRAADVLTVTNPPPFGSAASKFASFLQPAVLNATNTIIETSDGSANNVDRIFLASAANKAASANSLSGGVNPGRIDVGDAFSAGAAYRAASGTAASDRVIVGNGGTPVTSASGSFPVGMNAINIGSA